MSLLARFIVIVTIVVSATDAIVFYHARQHPERITALFVVEVIVITVIPIAINLWFWLKYRAKR
jgi:hypothetical protein